MIKKKNSKFPTAKQKASPYQSSSLYPLFDAGGMDIAMKWDDQEFSLECLKNILVHVLSYQKMTWTEIRSTGSHSVRIDQLSSKAQKRLRTLELEDIEELYSLRISASERLWAIKDNAILRLLWWDPCHKVCPCKKKHT